MTLVVSFVIIYLLSRLAATGSATARIIGNAIVSTASLAAASPEERMNEARQLAMKKLRPVLEPRLKEWGLEFEDVIPALEQVPDELTGTTQVSSYCNSSFTPLAVQVWLYNFGSGNSAVQMLLR